MLEMVKPKVTLLNGTEVAEALDEIGRFAGICYDARDGSDWEAVAMHVLYHEHATAYRHVKLKFRIEGVSRAFSHQHVRHNVGVEHNQRSQRYVDEEGFNFVVPPSLLDVNDGRPELREKFELFMLAADELYRELREAGIPAGDARYVLPNACETKLHTSFSLQALRHYCAERLCSAAQFEIREVARQMVKCVREVNPVLAKFLVVKCAPNALGYCPEDRKRWSRCKMRPHKSQMRFRDDWMS